MMKSITLIVTMGLTLSGCASSNRFSCAAAEGVGCMSARDVYESTSYGGQVGDTQTMISHRQTEQYSSRIHAPYVDIEAERPVPIRTPTRTIRVYVSSYEDERTTMLVAPHYIFQDVEQRMWVIGDENVSQTRRLGSPLEIEY